MNLQPGQWALVSCDWKEQHSPIDIEAAVRGLDGPLENVHEVDAGNDSVNYLFSSVPLTAGEAQEVFNKWLEDPS